MIARRSVLALCLLALLAACGEAAPRLAPLPEDAVVLAFGNSLTAGIGAEPDEGYPQVLARLIGRRVVASGVPGETTARGWARFAAELDRHHPALVVLCHGGNDLLRELDEAETSDNLRAMIETARARGIAVVLIGVPRPSLLKPAEGAGLYSELAADLALPYEATALAEVLGDRRLKADLVHPNAAGYRRLAEAVAALLRASGAI